jgi:transposase
MPMLSHKEKCFAARSVSLEELVPPNHFYRQLEAKLDLQFVYELVEDTYAPTMGRPSIDPVVFFKLQLIMFFEGIRSERQLMQTVNVNLAHRWYIGYDLDEAVPDHSSLSKIRARYGLEVFEQFFEKVVELCVAAGLVWGQELFFDGTAIRANADIDKLMPRAEWQAKQHVQALFQGTPEVEESASQQVAEPSAESAIPRQTLLVEKYRQPPTNEKHKSGYVRTADLKVSPTDPDATPMSRFTGDHAQLGYRTHYVVDGGKARIILAALVTPASVMDNAPMLDLARWVRVRWKLNPKIAVGDTKYGTVDNIVGLERDGIRAYLPMTDFSDKTGLYPAKQFSYDAVRDVYRCPQGQELKRYSRRAREEVILYRAKPKICNRCPVKAQCTHSRSGRHIFRSFYQDYIDRVRAYQDTEAYQKALRKRLVWVEPLFGEAKQWHQRVRFRLRGLRRVNIEGVLTAAGQNLKRLLKAMTESEGSDVYSSKKFFRFWQWILAFDIYV